MPERDNIYLDHAATSPPPPELLEVFREQLRRCAWNPGARYAPAVENRARLEASRSKLAGKLGCSPRHLIYTSGGSESNNLALHALSKKARGKRLWYSPTLHPSLAEPVRALELAGWECEPCATGPGGGIDVEKNLEGDGAPELLVLEWVNNELGFIQPVGRLAEALKQRHNRLKVLVDGVQGFCKLPLPDMKHIDAFSISGHKLGAPVGIGALMLRLEQPEPLILGGGQENGWRSGTTPVALIECLNAVVERDRGEPPPDLSGILRELNLKLYRHPACDYSPYIQVVDTRPVPGEILLHHLEEDGIYVGLGSACSSYKAGVSRVHLMAGLDEAESRMSLRVSLAPGQEPAAIEKALRRLRFHLDRLCATFGGGKA